jgi:adenylate cyclase
VIALSSAGLAVRSLARTARTRTIHAVAVLPLDNLSADPGQDYLVDGLTEALISDLARLGSLRVISRTSAMSYKGKGKSIPEIAGELGVDAVVEGSVVRSGDRVRVSVQLIDARREGHLWARTYDRQMADVMAVESEVAQAIAGEIKGRLTPEERERLTGRPVNSKAYLACARGRYLWNKRNEAQLKMAIGSFEEALKEEPGYALAYSGLADSHLYLGYSFGRVPPKEAMPKAKAAALKAIELDDSLAEAHTSLGLVRLLYEWDWPGAESEFRRAIDLNPSYATAHHGYAATLATMRRKHEAVEEARRALESDPLSVPVSNFLGAMLVADRRDDEALLQHRRTLELDPNLGMTLMSVALIFERKGMEQEAVRHLLKAKASSGESPAALEDFRRAAEQGGLRGFRTLDLERTLARWDGWHKTAYDIATLYARLGRRDEAIAWLEKIYEARSGNLIWLNINDTFDGLNADPRYQDLVRRIGLPREPAL